jgi:hypothetical protein
MSLLELWPKLKERKPEAIIALATILTTPLFLIVWRGWLYEKVAQGVESAPPEILGALVGLLTIWLLASLSFTILFAFRIKESKRRIFRFGVYWDKELIPHCPACSKPLGRYFCRAVASGIKGTWGFNCVECKEFISMYDDSGRVLELKEAKSLISLRQTELPPAPQIEPPLDATEIMILRLTAASTAPSMWPTTIAEISGLHLHAVKFHVHKLIVAGYLQGHSDVFDLTHKGRTYLMANKLLE